MRKNFLPLHKNEVARDEGLEPPTPSENGGVRSDADPARKNIRFLHLRVMVERDGVEPPTFQKIECLKQFSQLSGVLSPLTPPIYKNP